MLPITHHHVTYSAPRLQKPLAYSHGDIVADEYQLLKLLYDTLASRVNVASSKLLAYVS
jgi:hypothetical protein